MRSEPPLAAVVEKRAVEDAISTLREQGRYDDTRRIRERDDSTLEVPLSGTPDPLPQSVVRITEGAPTPRLRGLESRLRARGRDESAIAKAPDTWDVVGDVVIITEAALPEDRLRVVAEELRTLHGASTVVRQDAITGPHREPSVEVLLGDRTETVHTEHGTDYALDVAEVMFSPGNQAERVHMGDIVEGGEAVLDCFAGIGYFTLPMARNGATVTAVERNQTAYDYLHDNIELNGVRERVMPIHDDCRVVLAGDEVESPIDRLVLGHFEGAAVLPLAIPRLRSGGHVHLHATVPTDRTAGDPDAPERRLTAALSTHGRTLREHRRRVVKSYSEGIDHVVVDATID